MVDKMLASVPQLSLIARPQLAAHSARALRGLQKVIRFRRCQTVAGARPPTEDEPAAGEAAAGDINRRRMIIGAGSAGLLANVQGPSAAVAGPAASQGQAVQASAASSAAPAAQFVETTAARGMVAYRDPRVNHGLATSAENRALFRLNGLLPPGSCPSSVEVARAALNLRRCATPLDQYRYLMSLLSTDEDTFYATAIANLPALTPVLYTPTVGDACLNFSTLLPRPPGVYVSVRDKGRVRELLDGWPSQDVKVAVITDGERILGLGDLGANGMGIPTGKCMMYVAAGGMQPSWLLPVTLDVGTETASIREDPFYIGTRERRLRGPAYDELVDELVLALQDKYGPQVVVHWEDFNGRNSFRLLEKYKSRACTFNDDIQSTAAIVVACLLGSLRITGTSLKQQRVLFFGAGQANIGTANLLTSSLMAEGVPESVAVRQSWLFDSKGLVYQGRDAPISAEKMRYAHPPSALSSPLGAGAGMTFLDAVRLVRPTAIFGAAAKAKVFTKEVGGGFHMSCPFSRALVALESLMRSCLFVLVHSPPARMTVCHRTEQHRHRQFLVSPLWGC
eukprot:jgi/Mesvir1/973/Mv17522-RA.4